MASIYVLQNKINDKLYEMKISEGLRKYQEAKKWQ